MLIVGWLEFLVPWRPSPVKSCVAFPKPKSFPLDIGQRSPVKATEAVKRQKPETKRLPGAFGLTLHRRRLRFFGDSIVWHNIGDCCLDAMDETAKPKIEELDVELAFWKSLREVYRARGINLAQSLANWSAALAQGLTSPGAREEFAELCKAGCRPHGLAALITLFRYSPLLETFWSEMVGQPSNRERAARTLEAAAQTLGTLYGDAIALGTEGEGELFTRIGRIPASRMISELRAHVKFISFAESLSADTETRSPVEFSKYLLTAYVRRMTGRFHDRSVSGLVAEMIGSPEYNEVTQRMWRARNYDRLDAHFSGMAKFVVAMSEAVAQTT